MTEYRLDGSAPALEIERVKKTFFLNVHQLQTKDSDRLNNIFSSIDSWLINKNLDKKDRMKHYRDIPMPLERLYKESDYIKSRHGHDLQIKIEPH